MSRDKNSNESMQKEADEELWVRLRVIKEKVISSTRMNYCGYIWHPQWVVEMFPEENLRSSSGVPKTNPARQMKED